MSQYHAKLGVANMPLAQQIWAILHFWMLAGCKNQSPAIFMHILAAADLRNI